VKSWKRVRLRKRRKLLSDDNVVAVIVEKYIYHTKLPEWRYKEDMKGEK